MTRQKTGEAKTLADEAVSRIREDIVKGRLTPGEKLQPDALKELYGIGTSPVREALSRLASDGLVQAESQRGFFVAPVLVDELRDVADLRCRFSSLGLRRSIERGDDAWESGVVAAFYQLGKIAKSFESEPERYAEVWEQRNRAFHAALEQACGSPWLRHFCQMLYDQSERYRRRFVKFPRLRPEVEAEHQAVMDAALARDADRACGILEAHIRGGAETVERLMLAEIEAEGPRRAAR
jgi:DNA-binding GntR family transcriptional regulator